MKQLNRPIFNRAKMDNIQQSKNRHLISPQFGGQSLNTHLVAEIDKERDREREWMMKRNRK